ncbi:MAG: alanine--tRNA ligase [Candidatus Woesearchaeota archaeon]
MDSATACRKFLDYFRSKGHKIIPSDSLLPSDRSVLLTTAGMQQFKPYFSDVEKAQQVFGAKRVASVQKCFRTSDLDSVGDESHLTFFEMLGNFSFGDYFKEEAIGFGWEFLTKEMRLPKEKMAVTIFKGDNEVPFDEEALKAWKKIGISESIISKCSREDNFWGPTGEEGPCGPTTEIYVNGCEVWNLVFNEYYMDRQKKLTKLKYRGVDTGMGLERLAMVLQNKGNVFETDLFEPIMKKINELGAGNCKESMKRVIADHSKGAVFLTSEGIMPSNVEQGYILRRIMRRLIRCAKLAGLKEGYFEQLAGAVVSIYKSRYPELEKNRQEIIKVFSEEKQKFEKSLDNGTRQFERLTKDKKIVSGKDAFLLYQSFGFPLEVTKDLACEKGISVDEKGFEEELKSHQDVSRAGVEKKFGGVGSFGEQVVRQHTAAHLLHTALRKVLGEHVQQAGSDMTPERLRLDFTHPKKMTPEEIKKVEGIVNEQIKAALPVKMEKMKYEDAIKSGALGFFKEKYPAEVNVYTIGNFSKEICAGPHVKNTSEIGSFKIKKEESTSAGVRRIKAVVG